MLIQHASGLFKRRSTLPFRALMLYVKERNRKAGSAAKNPTESSVNAEVVAASVVGKALTSQSCLSIEIVSWHQ